MIETTTQYATLIQCSLPVLFLFLAALYASVGMGGGSSYTAILALFGFAATKIASTALALNLIVAGMAFFSFYQSNHVRWKLLGPLVLASVPASFSGGWIPFDNSTVMMVLGGALLLAGGMMWTNKTLAKQNFTKNEHSLLTLVLIGMGLGFLAGVTGIGGGIFLVPVLILFGLAEEKETAGVAAAFVWLNSAAGLLAHGARGHVQVPILLPLIIAVFIGGFIGSSFAAWNASRVWIRRIAGTILMFAAGNIFLNSML